MGETRNERDQSQEGTRIEKQRTLTGRVWGGHFEDKRWKGGGEKVKMLYVVELKKNTSAAQTTPQTRLLIE